MLIDVEHRMHFDYQDFIRDSQMEIRIEPLALPIQALHSFQMTVGPHASVERYIDWNGNWVHYLSIRDYHDQIEILARSLVDTRPDASAIDRLNQDDPQPAQSRHPDFARFEGPVEDTPALDELADALAISDRAPLGEQVMAVGDLLGSSLEYRPGVTNWRSNVADVLAHRSGVCQDFTHVALALLRRRNIPCRYVSGYLHVEVDTSQSHAWIEVYGENAGWVGYDPTHQTLPTDRYVTVATGRSYEDVPPNRGVYRGAAREVLKAAVHTESATSVDVVQLRRQTEGIDVPLYAELPSRAQDNPTRSGDLPDSRREQQQQQQQQKQKQKKKPRQRP